MKSNTIQSKTWNTGPLPTRNKVLLISLPGLNTGNEPIFPLGIGYLVSALKLDREVMAVHYQKMEHARAQLPSWISYFRPDLIGLTCTTFNRGNVRKTIQWIRSVYPKIRIILGGVHVSYLYEQALREYGADYVVIGEGDQTIRELCSAIDEDRPLQDIKGIAFEQDAQVIVTPKREVIAHLDDLPLPDYSFAAHLIKASGMGFVISSRGCPVRCNFCSTSSYWGQEVRLSSPGRVATEMEMLVSEYGVRKIFLHDDTFNINIARVSNICNEIVGHNLSVEWGVSCRVRPVSQEMVDSMVEAGCRHICWGIESGSDEMLSRIGKKITCNQIRSAFELCRKHLGRISVGAFTMVGNPGESAATVGETVEFLNTIPLTDAPSTSVLCILPGTALYQTLVEKNPKLDRYWVETDQVPCYTLEHSIEKLSEWAKQVSASGNLVAFDKSGHFWNNVLFGQVPPAREPEGPSLRSELDTVIPPEISDDEFYFVIEKLTREEKIKNILEIGSSSGTGSTAAFASGLSANPARPVLYCMEISKARFYELKHRYANNPSVKCYNVSSVSADRFPTEAEVAKFYNTTATSLNDYPLQRVLEWLRQDLEYTLQYGVIQNGIKHIKREIGIEQFDMVLIDGSEFSGPAELDEVYGSKYLLLDDVRGFKNFHNFQRLSADRAYTIIASNLGLRNGYAVFKRTDDAIETTVVEAGSCATPTHEIREQLPIHFFTIVLNGEPFIRYHIDQFKKLSCRWHWHIIEGVADLVHDTAWSVQGGGRITSELHRRGLSRDGTTQYLDHLAGEYPENITIYRKRGGAFWSGKVEMVNAPLEDIQETCLLWQVDADELWTTNQITTARRMFMRDPCRTAAYYRCWFFVGERLITTTPNTYGNHSDYEWLRTWRFQPGFQWVAHEPPRLCQQTLQGEWVDRGAMAPFRHCDTEPLNLVFQHYAYVTDAQLRFKEIYYGYKDAVEQWRALQRQQHFPVALRDYFSWVNDNTVIDTVQSRNVMPLASKDSSGHWIFRPGSVQEVKPRRVLWVRTDSIGDNLLAASMLPHIEEKYRDSRIAVLVQKHIAEIYQECPHVDEIIPFDKIRAYQDERYRGSIVNLLRSMAPDVVLNSVYSREIMTDLLALSSNAPERVAFLGNLDNIPSEARDRFNPLYTRLITNGNGIQNELDRHAMFLKALGTDVSGLKPMIWTSPQDESFADQFFQTNHLHSNTTIALLPGAQWNYKVYEHYTSVLEHFTRFNFLLFGDKNDTAMVATICEKFPQNTYNLAGMTTLRRTAALMRRCRIYVGADSSAAHIACAVDLPNVVILGGGHFGRFLPYSFLTSIVCLPLACYGCNWDCKYQRPHCVKDIDPQVVVAAVRQTLAAPAAKPRVFRQPKSCWNPGNDLPEWKWCESLPTDSVEVISL